MYEFFSLAEAPQSLANDWVSGSVQLLHSQWPHLGSIEYRTKKLKASCEKGGLPQSFVLVEKDNRTSVVGHVRLQEAADVSSGHAAALTSVVVSPTLRGKGIGRILMRCVEEHARGLGFGYMYLWTNEAIGFYEKLDYHKCDRVSLSLPVFNRLGRESTPESIHASTSSNQGGSASVNHEEKKDGGPEMDEDRGSSILECLEKNLASKLARALSLRHVATPVASADDSNVRAIPPPPNKEDHRTEEVQNVWMRKRLKDFVASEPLQEAAEFIKSVYDAVRNSTDARDGLKNPHLRLAVAATQVPWQQQIGPTCGLTALRMVSEFMEFRAGEIGQKEAERELLLKEAVRLCYTSEGEMFDLDNLHALAKSALGLECSIEETPLAASQLLTWLLAGSLVIFPYDRASGSNTPALLGGTTAHYCILIGVAVCTLGDEEDQDIAFSLNKDVSESDRGAIEAAIASSDPGAVLVIAQHSSRNHFLVAPWEDFYASNAQLSRPKQSTHSATRWKTKVLSLAKKCLVVHPPRLPL